MQEPQRRIGAPSAQRLLTAKDSRDDTERALAGAARQARGPARTSASAIVAGALMAVLGMLILAACGSSSTSKASSTSASASASSTAGGAQTAQATSGRCRHVPAPASRAGERAPMPTKRLDPADSYTVTLTTNCGQIAIALDVKRAPKTSASFASLVQRGFYNELTFHRIVPNFVIQGGDPNGNGTGGPGYTVVEAPPAGLQYTRGIVAMAKTGTDPSGASGSQFFIVTAANANLPAQYALVGRVVSGESAVDAIARVPTVAGADGEESTPSIPIVIEKATLAVG